MSVQHSSISVIIPTYQHARTLSACLKSLLNQTAPPTEIIVVDDGSTDSTRKIVGAFGKQVMYFYQSNQGAPVARNYGAKFATGDLLLFCDADVVASPGMLEKMSKTLNDHPGISYVYCGFRWAHKRFRSRPFDPTVLLHTNFIHTTSLLRAADFPCFDPTLKRFQDWDLWLTLLRKGKWGLSIDEELFRIQLSLGRKGISVWLPSFFYKIPWDRLGWIPDSISAYESARAIIKRKHAL